MGAVPYRRVKGFGRHSQWLGWATWDLLSAWRRHGWARGRQVGVWARREAMRRLRSMHAAVERVCRHATARCQKGGFAWFCPSCVVTCSCRHMCVNCQPTVRGNCRLRSLSPRHHPRHCRPIAGLRYALPVKVETPEKTAWPYYTAVYDIYTDTKTRPRAAGWGWAAGSCRYNGEQHEFTLNLRFWPPAQGELSHSFPAL